MTKAQLWFELQMTNKIKAVKERPKLWFIDPIQGNVCIAEIADGIIEPILTIHGQYFYPDASICLANFIHEYFVKEVEGI